MRLSADIPPLLPQKTVRHEDGPHGRCGPTPQRYRAGRRTLGVAEPIRRTLSGTVFEVRQGYKSKDSKRQNADIANASTAYTRAYLPCVAVLSTQIDGDIVIRYRNERWGHPHRVSRRDVNHSINLCFHARGDRIRFGRFLRAEQRHTSDRSPASAPRAAFSLTQDGG